MFIVDRALTVSQLIVDKFPLHLLVYVVVIFVHAMWCAPESTITGNDIVVAVITSFTTSLLN